jgi:hypothetical protein
MRRLRGLTEMEHSDMGSNRQTEEHTALVSGIGNQSEQFYLSQIPEEGHGTVEY